MENKYYLPISSISLAHYFGCACVMPSKYFKNKPEDFQDKLNEFLLITTHFGTQQTDCCIELVLTKQEKEDLIDIKEGWFLYEKPLPITRIIKIYFISKDKKEQTITNINMSTAFVPVELIEIVNDFDNAPLDNIEKPKDIYDDRYVDKIKTFDSFLGGLALMRLAGEENMNYSENYFATLAFFNENILRELEYAKEKNPRIYIDVRYQGAFNGKNGFDKIIPYLSKVINENDVNSIAQEERQTLQKDKITRIIDLNSLDKWTYTIAVLNTYGVGNESKKKKIDELILSNFKSDIKPGKSEGIALCFGINRGYSLFSNKYNLGKAEKIVKFQLNSQLDYYTIESVYQFVFNETKSNSFPYLDNWCPKMKWSKISRNTDYKILDVMVIGKKKPKVFSQEYLASLLQRFFQKENEGLFKDIFEKITTIVYNDTLEEINNEIELRDEEIKRLNKEIDKISKLEIEINRLMNENQSIKSKELVVHYQEPISNKTVVEEPINESSNFDKRMLIKQVLLYKEKNKTMLEKEAKEKGILIPKGAKLDHIIVLLMTTPNNLSNSKLQFPE